MRIYKDELDFICNLGIQVPESEIDEFLSKKGIHKTELERAKAICEIIQKQEKKIYISTGLGGIK